MTPLSPEAERVSRELAQMLGQEPVQVSATRWKFTPQTDRSEAVHFVDYLAGTLYCTCRGFVTHKHCRHSDKVKEILMNDEDYPMTRDVVTTNNFAGAVAVHRSPQELRARLEEMKLERGLVASFMRDVMEPSTEGKADGDYGIIPGTDKPTLFKPGAEKLCELYGYAPTIKNREEMIDTESGHYRVVITIALVQKGTGAVIAEGIGECNTREARYFYRWMPEWELRKFPELWDVRSTFKKQEFEYTPKTGTNAGRKQKSTRYRVENEDLFTLWNTVLKMAKKRALVDVVLSATRSSGIFSQSMASLNDWIEAEYEDVTDAHEAPAATESRLPDTSGKQATSQPDPQCEHDVVVDEASSLLVCKKCGLVLEEPPPEVKGRQQAMV